MKNRFNVWIREPYGTWMIASPRPISRQAATSLEKELQESKRPIAIVVKPVGERPE